MRHNSGIGQLILVKHAMPVVTDGVAPALWPLSDAGRQAAARLAPRWAGAGVERVLTSREPKAAQTGRIVAAALGVPCSEWPDLHEHDRSDETSLDSERNFEERARVLFERPDELTWGRETAAAARDRFGAAVRAAMTSYPDGTLVIVAHGTVIALLLAALTGEPAFALWRRLGLPSYAVLTRPGLTPIELVGSP